MGDFQYFDIILFAMIAAFLVLRLRSVLGRRTGNERRRELFTRRPAPVADKPAPDKVARPADGNKVTPIAVPTAKPADPVSEGLNRVRRADPSFEPSQFIDGARVAFEMIVTAFAKGDKAALRPLLSDEVFRPFAQTIDERVAANETVETRDLKLEDAEIVEADMTGRTARVTVKLVSHQIALTRAMDGSIVDGDPDHPVEKTDYWTFARDTRSADPNWMLVTTSSG
ncbi:MAG TPA: Tim44/TimA family putative adaptor protein [Stellaceae bacterium]|jgi:predicted lipid-binding transport protein (Tim44 family)|nr:Tim44/TimA family putative adaptor protein [Stellaceae bacterium]